MSYSRFKIQQSISPTIRWDSVGAASSAVGSHKRAYHNWQLLGIGVDAIVWQNAGGIGDTPIPTPTPGIGLSTPAYRAPVDFVFGSDYMAGVRVPKFRAPNKPIGQRRLPKQPENIELREMMGLYSMWRDAA